ncbi:hypothetical protein [Kocuria sabuli]|uniref:hypothetical protein n=1 Tax=Kocuria sabuli TaxID=3071448 RepID=UPI0034D66336
MTVTLASRTGAAVLVAFRPGQGHVHGPTFPLLALFLGLGTGGVFGWVGRAAPAEDVGTVGGIIAAAVGLGRCFPPLVMGATYDAENNSHFVGPTLLAGFAALSLTVRSGGKVDERPRP